MRRMIVMLIFGFTAASAWAIPSDISYQGTLKEKGLPVTSTKTFTFQLTSEDGLTPYSDVISQKTNVVNGLFSAHLNFKMQGTNTWESITPYLKITVNGQAFTKTEPISATAYANVSNTVVNGAITSDKLANGSVTSTKLDSSVQNFLFGAGIMVPYAGPNPPAGWLLCDGAAVSRIAYANLFSAIGITWGSGDGTTTFNVPDIRGRTLIEKASSGTFATLGSKGGSETHSHSLNTVTTHNTGNLNLTVLVGANGQLGAAEAGLDFTSTGATINTNSVENIPPYAVVNYIIKI